MLSVDAITLTYIHRAHTPAHYLSILQCSVHIGADKGVSEVCIEAHAGHAGRGLRPQGAQRRRGGTPPPALSGEASTVANKPSERIRTQYGTPRRTAPTKRNLDTENPRRPVANYSTAGVSRTLPCGRILKQRTNQP